MSTLENIELKTQRGQETLVYNDRLYRIENSTKGYVNANGSTLTRYWICCHTTGCKGRGKQLFDIDPLNNNNLTFKCFSSEV